jgi:hypothetical protein
MAKKRDHKPSTAHLYTTVKAGTCPSSPKLNISLELTPPAAPQLSSSATLISENVEVETNPTSAGSTGKCTANQKNATENQYTAATERGTYRSHNSRALYPANRCIVGKGKKPADTSAGSAASTYRSGGREAVRRISPSASSPTVLWRTLLTGDSRLRGKRFNPFWIAETDPRNFLS